MSGALNLFSHTASAALGGDRYPCASPHCRTENAKELAQFAALYSDKVYIRNFLADHCASDGDSGEIKLTFEWDMEVLSHLMPLIEDGKIELVTFDQCLCPSCTIISALEQNAEKEYARARKDLIRRFYKEVSFSIRFDEGYLGLNASGPESLVPPHGAIEMDFKPEQLWDILPDIAEKIEHIGEIRLTTIQAKNIKAAESILDGTIRSVAFQLDGAHFLRNSYLTESDTEVDFIQSLTSDPVVKKRNALMRKYLDCLVPFLSSIETSDLLKLRRDEGDAFLSFRRALSNAVEEYKTNGLKFTSRDAQILFSDVIQPRLAEIDSKLNTARRRFRKSFKRKILSWMGSLSVGLFTGHFIDPLSGIVAGSAFKIMETGVGGLETLMSESDVKEQVRTDEMYFLWRVKEIAQQTVNRNDHICQGGIPSIIDH